MTDDQDDPQLRLKYYRETGQQDEATKYEQYLRETGQLAAPTTPGQRDFHAEYKSGALQKGMQRINQGEREIAEAEDEESRPGIAASITDAVQGASPGIALAQTGLRALLRRQPYREAYADIKSQTDKVPTSAKVVGRMAASIPLAARLPGGAAAGGAMIGAADQLLSADPDKGIVNRAVTAPLAAAGGAVVGKLAEMLPSAVRAVAPKWLGGAEKTSTNLIRRQAERAASAKELYTTALGSGQGKAGTKAVQEFLQEPHVAGIVKELQETTHQGVTPDSPEMLDAVYKTLSDQAGTVKKGLESISPNKPNIGRFRGDYVGKLKASALDAMSGPRVGPPSPGTPGKSVLAGRSPSGRHHGPAARNPDPATDESGWAADMAIPRMATTRPPAEVPTTPSMPGYRTAVQDFAKRSGEMEGVKKGSDALRARLTSGVPSGKNMTRTTPEAFSDWMTKNPGMGGVASEGILGTTKMAVANDRSLLRSTSRRAISSAPSLLRSAGNGNQQVIDMLIKAGLIATAPGSGTHP